MTGNSLTQCKTTAAYTLPGASPEDFCAFYEANCMYDPTGMALNKGKPPTLADAKSTDPWFFKDYNDCLSRYMMSTMTSQSCRAGQLCKNKAGGCTHSTGHFSVCPATSK
jgi:hypothetical protein